MTVLGYSPLETGLLQIGWTLLILASPVLFWLAGRAVGLGGAATLAVVAVVAAAALVAVAGRPDEPLHANGHAWREAREVHMPVGVRAHGLAPFMHGKSGIALQWLLAGAERALTGTVNPFRISRAAGAAATGATALLVMVLVRSPWAGLAAGIVLALMPLARMFHVSGSALAVAAWILPWSLALTLAAAFSGSRWLLAAAALAAALGSMSHTAMLVWPAGLAVAWLSVARREVRWSAAAETALLLVAAAWAAQLVNAYDMLLSRNQGEGLLTQAWRGFQHRDLFVAPAWVSPLLLPLLALWVLTNLAAGRRGLLAATIIPLALIAVPLFAVNACSSDAVRYQGAMIGLVTALAVAGLWCVPLARRIGRPGTVLVRIASLAALVVLPLPAMQHPLDPVAFEHRLVEDAVRQMAPGTVVILPAGRFLSGRVITDFPDFVLPPGSLVLVEGDARIAEYAGPRLLYLGLACISWDPEEPGAPGSPTATSGMRPECRALRGNARPWMVRSLAAADLPQADGAPWTFHRLATDEPFGFFAP